MNDVLQILYTAEATAVGGREGHARTSDGRVDVALDVPREMGGSGGPGTNPEQLFATGYAACFQSALLRIAAGGEARPERVSDHGTRWDRAIEGRRFRSCGRARPRRTAARS
jgi:organic hydroperoxide reductase OsmC/OhrA